MLKQFKILGVVFLALLHQAFEERLASPALAGSDFRREVREKEVAGG